MKKHIKEYIVIVTLVFFFCSPGTVLARSNGSVSSSHVFYNGSGASKQVALSFDDGPDAHYTIQILDILKKYNIKATFFVVGIRAKAHPEIVKRMVDEGHVIGNHSWDHGDLSKLSEKAALSEVSRAEDEIFNITGYRTDLFRPPYGSISSRIKTSLVSRGYNIVFWSVDTKDWAGTSVSGILDDVRSEVHPGGIILQHCLGNLSNTVKALPQIISYLQGKGYSFVTIPEILNVPSSFPVTPPAPVYANADKAQQLHSMGLYDGISTTVFNPDLGTVLDRETGIALLLKMLGKKADVLAMSDADASAALAGFKDADKISPWTRKYAAFALKNALCSGITGDMFGPATPLDAPTFCAIILRDLGYTVTDTGTAVSMLKEKGGLLDEQVKALSGKSAFIKDDAVGIAYSALNAVDAGGKKLIDSLIAAGIVTQPPK